MDSKITGFYSIKFGKQYSHNETDIKVHLSAYLQFIQHTSTGITT